MEIHNIDDAVAFVRSHPEMFLRDGVLRADELASNLVSEAAILGVFPITVDRINGWWVVAAEEDWLAKENECSAEVTFNRVVPFPKAGANSMRAEILLTSFASNVVTCTGGKKVLIKGDKSALDEIEPTLINRYAKHRVVAFRLTKSDA